MTDPPPPPPPPPPPHPPCRLFTITQYECSPSNDRITCWPLERLFRQCGKDGPAVEVTHLVEPSRDDPERPVIPEHALSKLPRGRMWRDVAVESAVSAARE
ncbi:hypothetical protein NliqN6_0990 [Naganishia liquefaciens]|uniref:Uncharacterized protein n=1 Tax=Naganishia liquefaciens TaxID=104408 RepID=A0A8H3TPK0_9TREE|nr:hypothetical protein NliqN6_0990 [Naganishia liquefaciens]